jgi:hypothetical protein
LKEYDTELQELIFCSSCESALINPYIISAQRVDYVFTESVVFPDPATFRQIGDKGPVAVDKDYAYWGTSRFEADPATLTCILPGVLYKDSRAVYAYGAKLGRTDASSFKLLGQSHPCLALATDNQQRFIFESLTGGFMSQPQSLHTNAAKLKKVLSITRVPIEGDENVWIEKVARSFVPTGMAPDEDEETSMIAQGGECYLQTRRRVPCDPATFEVVSSTTGRDKDQFYWATTIIPEVDKDSVAFIDSSFYKDKNHVFSLWGTYVPIPNADPVTFRFLEPPSSSGRYAVDKSAGFCLMYGSQRLKIRRMKLADPTKLRVLKPAFATDGVTTFEDGVPVKSQ